MMTNVKRHEIPGSLEKKILDEIYLSFASEEETIDGVIKVVVEHLRDNMRFEKTFDFVDDDSVDRMNEHLSGAFDRFLREVPPAHQTSIEGEEA